MIANTSVNMTMYDFTISGTNGTGMFINNSIDQITLIVDDSFTDEPQLNLFSGGSPLVQLLVDHLICAPPQNLEIR